MWTFHRLESLFRDLRYALRTLVADPGFSLVVTLTLALGIGATAAVFSVFDAAVLRPLPYSDPERLVILHGNVQRETIERRGTSLADYADWRDQSRSFEAMALFTQTSRTLHAAEGPERVFGEFVAEPYFRLLGVAPKVGRTFLPEEDQVPQRDAVAVLSAGLWQRVFDGDPEVVGRSVRLDDRSYTVVGVAPEGFRGVSDQADFWLPLHMVGPPRFFASRGSRGPSVLAKLNPGVPLAQAQAEMDEICLRLEQAYPETNEGRGVELSPLSAELFGDARTPLTILLAAVGLVLLIACSNVANLLLVRAETRRHEVAVRTALGAGRGRVLGQMAAESLLLAAAGMACGLLFAVAGVRALVAFSPVTLPSFVAPTVDWRVVLFAAALTLGAVLFVGLAPAFQMRSVQPFEAFKQTARTGTGGRSGRGLRDFVVAGQVAVAMLLLVGAGLLMRSLDQLARLDLGYDPSNTLTMRVSLPSPAPPPDESGESSNPAESSSSVRELLRAVAAVPGVNQVAAATDTPLSSSAAVFYTAEGQTSTNAQTRPRAYYHRVTPEFFEALAIPFLAGTTFTAEQADQGASVAVVSENLAQRFWPGQSALGKRIKFGGQDSDSEWLAIVGVVNEMKYRGVPDNSTDDPDVFLPFSGDHRNFAVVAQTSIDPASATGALRSALRRADPRLTVYAASTLRSRTAHRTSGRRFVGWLMGVFAASALVLAMIGIYGLLSYSISRRTREISVRMALGARRSDVLRMVARGSFSWIGAGLLVGGAAALVGTRFLDALLYGVAPHDPLTFAGAAAVLALVASSGALAPALRASRVAPAAALRE